MLMYTCGDIQLGQVDRAADRQIKVCTAREGCGYGRGYDISTPCVGLQEVSLLEGRLVAFCIEMPSQPLKVKDMVKMFNKKYQARLRSSCKAADRDGDDDDNDDTDNDDDDDEFSDDGGGSDDCDTDEGRDVGGDGLSWHTDDVVCDH